MSDLNSFCCTGRLVKNSEYKEFATGKKMIQFNIAINGYKSKEGKDNTTFIAAKHFMSTDFLIDKLLKGSRVSVQGEIKIDKYESEGQAKYFTYILARNINLLDPKKPKDFNDEIAEEGEVAF